MKHAIAGFTLALLSLPSLHAQAAVELCHPTPEVEIENLFSLWNASLQTGDATQVAALYREDAILLPTVSAVPRLSHEARLDYFRHFLKDGPTGRLDTQQVQIGCNEATAAGLYTFEMASTGKRIAARYTFTYRWDGQRWLITQHHSSLLPQG